MSDQKEKIFICPECGNAFYNKNYFDSENKCLGAWCHKCKTLTKNYNKKIPVFDQVQNKVNEIITI